MYFEYIVDHADQLPLSVDLLLSSKTESFEAYAARDISKYRLDCTQSLAIDVPPHHAVDLLFHLFDEAGLLMLFGVAEFYGELAWTFLGFRSETTLSELAVSTVTFIGLEFHEQAVADPGLLAL